MSHMPTLVVATWPMLSIVLLPWMSWVKKQTNHHSWYNHIEFEIEQQRLAAKSKALDSHQMSKHLYIYSQKQIIVNCKWKKCALNARQDWTYSKRRKKLRITNGFLDKRLHNLNDRRIEQSLRDAQAFLAEHLVVAVAEFVVVGGHVLNGRLVVRCVRNLKYSRHEVLQGVLYHVVRERLRQFGQVFFLFPFGWLALSHGVLYFS